jgi:oxygen-independent coproporphyrinogen-3 oxidase
LIRELILLLKRGFLEVDYFRNKFHVDVWQEFSQTWAHYLDQGWVTYQDGRIELTMEGLLRVDGLLPAFFEPEHRGVRYT